MEYYDGHETVKQKLIIAGIKEIEMHGITDCSLRRVASACNVSCAAPYKHFKSKEDFIAEIVLYIHSKWTMLEEQVMSVFEGDVRKQLTETCIAYIKFWIANPNFRTVLMLKTDTFGTERRDTMTKIAEGINVLIKKCCKLCDFDEGIEKQKIYKIRSLLYGATLMMDNGELTNDPGTVSMIKDCISSEFVIRKKTEQ